MPKKTFQLQAQPQTPTSPLLSVSSLSKKRAHRQILDKISFSLEKGQIMGILGANGAGKTTLLKIIATVILPDTGAVEVQGINAIKQPKRACEKIGYLSEQAPLYLSMSVVQFLRLKAALGGLPKVAIDDAVNLAMAHTSLSSRRHDIIATLSKGWRQRVALAGALVAGSTLLLLDEPSSGLDPLQRELMHAMILRQKKEGKGVVFSSHIVEEVEKLCDVVLLLDGGKQLKVLKKEKGNTFDIAPHKDIRAFFLSLLKTSTMANEDNLAFSKLK